MKIEHFQDWVLTPKVSSLSRSEAKFHFYTRNTL